MFRHWNFVGSLSRLYDYYNMVPAGITSEMVKFANSLMNKPRQQKKYLSKNQIINFSIDRRARRSKARQIVPRVSASNQT